MPRAARFLSSSGFFRGRAPGSPETVPRDPPRPGPFPGSDSHWLLELRPVDADEYAEREELLERILEALGNGE